MYSIYVDNELITDEIWYDDALMAFYAACKMYQGRVELRLEDGDVDMYRERLGEGTYR